jgi:uncharacterized membrane protein
MQNHPTPPSHTQPPSQAQPPSHAQPLSHDATEAASTFRIEAFTDAVMAIAITLLVIELKVPHVDPAHPSLLQAVLDRWPGYLAYFVSFWSIGLAWLIHHNMFKLIRRTSHTLLLVNTLFLLFVAIVPHPTAIVAEYLESETEYRSALFLYSATWLLVGLMINLLWFTARKQDLLTHGLAATSVRSISRQYLLGVPLYVLALGLSLVSFEATIVIYIVIGIYYSLPGPDQVWSLIWKRRRHRKHTSSEPPRQPA